MLAGLFGLFVLFLYGPSATIALLSFQGPQGGLTFPLQGVSMHWFIDLFSPQSLGDIWGAFGRSCVLGLLVMVLTVVLSFLAGLAFRTAFSGSSAVFYIAVASLIMPSVVVSLGIGAMYEFFGLARAWYSSALGAHLTWTLPFGLLIMFAVFNRFNKAYEEAAHDLGASGWQTLRRVVLPMVFPSLVGVALFGFAAGAAGLADERHNASDLRPGHAHHSPIVGGYRRLPARSVDDPTPPHPVP
jgi:putative spermidine/putrescine transport system permease protein